MPPTGGAGALPPTYVFEDLRGVLLDHVLRADLMLTGLAINSLLFGKEYRPGHGPEPRHLTVGVSHYMREGSRQVISSTELGKAGLTTGGGRDEVRSRENKFGGGSGSGSQCSVGKRPASTADITPHTCRARDGFRRTVVASGHRC
jgi:hypothetical protein